MENLIKIMNIIIEQVEQLNITVEDLIVKVDKINDKLSVIEFNNEILNKQRKFYDK